MKQLQRFGTVAAGLLGVFLPLTQGSAQSVTAVPKLDLNRYVGAWYEMARLPNKQEKQCVADAEILYALADKPRRFQLVNTCRLKDGSSNVRNFNGRAQDKSGDGKFKVTILWPMAKKYWVLALDPDYKWALVGSPNHKTLWILSRTPVMDPETLTAVEAKASAQGFNVSKLIATKQRP